MWLIEEIAEQHIRRAMEQGLFDDLPGAGTPLVLDDNRMVPEELRAGYRLLKNAGYVPPEVDSLREIHDLQSLLAGVVDPGKRDKGIRRLRLLEARLAEGRGRGLSTAVQQQYSDKLLAAFAKSERDQ